MMESILISDDGILYTKPSTVPDDFTGTKFNFRGNDLASVVEFTNGIQLGRISWFIEGKAYREVYAVQVRLEGENLD